ncbi:glycosyltransferase involved in cell wall biosynthesis [Bacillus tianshenii]|uniref:Glycosyltransferase involved in cell wall biosynthesis n=1 Tax=Sutcliffiella tianshenii TaxID=1463404 RepID=A0ABS2NV82_9BACI|nr:glycosyltransferase [Bacillus tianshenii]MBM7618392.1 glycosyltransferase involved in cell wall biosynthesis [Bacillus tianshenii]
MKKHIAFFIPVLTFGGAEKVIITLANGFAELDYRVDLVLVKKNGQLLTSVSPKVNLVDLGAKKTFFSIWKLSSYLKQEEPDVLLSALDNANIIASAAIRLASVKTRHVISLHTNLKQSYLKPRTMMHRIYPGLMRWLFPYASGYVAVSKCVAEESGEFLGIPSGNIDVIYNPVIDNSITCNAMEAISHPWLDNNQFFTIVSVGRIFEAKDYPTLLYAFSKVYSERTDARLIILGDGKTSIKKEMHEIIDRMKLQDVVDLYGFAPNPYTFIKRASLFVLTSRWEGFGNVLVEALHLGTPVVSTNCKCGPEEILKNGEFGKLVDVGDRNGLASAILQYMEHPVEFDQNKVSDHLSQMEKSNVIRNYEKILVRDR